MCVCVCVCVLACQCDGAHVRAYRRSRGAGEGGGGRCVGTQGVLFCSHIHTHTHLARPTVTVTGGAMCQKRPSLESKRPIIPTVTVTGGVMRAAAATSWGSGGRPWWRLLPGRHTFSNVSALVHLLCKGAIQHTSENLRLPDPHLGFFGLGFRV